MCNYDAHKVLNSNITQVLYPYQYITSMDTNSRGKIMCYFLDKPFCQTRKNIDENIHNQLSVKPYKLTFL